MPCLPTTLATTAVSLRAMLSKKRSCACGRLHQRTHTEAIQDVPCCPQQIHSVSSRPCQRRASSLLPNTCCSPMSFASLCCASCQRMAATVKIGSTTPAATRRPSWDRAMAPMEIGSLIQLGCLRKRPQPPPLGVFCSVRGSVLRSRKRPPPPLRQMRIYYARCAYQKTSLQVC